ncbi:RNA-binding protein 43 isoform X1 [Lates japonicus]|uniref:RNA-binding protein 43 isoform X1 n=1 Tax=Lates japonicus TaxID=270547 RepID=A0AAD3N2H3_LATJO|nr:RNA-binding protein 43 isoform X1 [Lates japonicus]
METDSLDQSRTVVVSGVPDLLPADRMVDKLTIHFQTRRRSDGGDVEVVKYPTNMEGVAFVTFDRAEDAERVVRKEQQIMMDSKFPQDYHLTVFPFTRDVFLYVSSAKVDLSIFGSNQAQLIQSLRSAHRSLRFQPLHGQRKATIEGPFAAIRALREDLIRRAGRLKSTFSATAADVELGESQPNPRVISDHEFVGSVSRSSFKAKRELAGSNSLPRLLQSTGEAAEVQSLLSNAKTQNAFSRQKVSSTVGTLSNTDSVEEEKLGAWSTLTMSTQYRTKQAKAKPRQVFGEEINAGIRSSLSALDLVPAEKISAKQPGVDDILQKHTRPDRISATKTKRENHLGSRHNSTDYLKKSDQSSSAVHINLLQTRLKDISTSSGRKAEDTVELSAICPEDLDDTCTWIDSYIFRYIEKFEKTEFDRCLRGLRVSVQCTEGNDLVRISLTEKQTSKTASGIQQALINLKMLVEFWISILRVHEVSFDKEKQKLKLTQICKDVNILFDDVLYVFEDSCIKIVGPSVSSFLFYKTVKDRLDKTLY